MNKINVNYKKENELFNNEIVSIVKRIEYNDYSIILGKGKESEFYYLYSVPDFYRYCTRETLKECERKLKIITQTKE